MSIFIRRSPLHLLPSKFLSKKYMSCRYPENSNMFSTTFNVCLFTLICSSILKENIRQVYILLEEDNKKIKKQLEELAKK